MPTADRFFIKDGYVPRPQPRSLDPTDQTRYWTDERIAASTYWQHDVYRLARRLLQVRRPATILDFGCGSGLKAKQQLGDLGELLLVDQANAERIVERLWPGTAFRPMDLEAPTPLDRRFDLIVCADVIEHLADPTPCLRFIAEQLADDGLALVSTPERDLVRGVENTEPTHPEHVREWNADELQALMTHCGLAVDRIELLPQHRLSAAETALRRIVPSRWRHGLVGRRWTGCQTAVCRRAASAGPAS